MSTILKALQKVEGQRQRPPTEGLKPSDKYQASQKSFGDHDRKLRQAGFLLLLATCFVVASSGLWYVTRPSSKIQSTGGTEISSGRGQVEQVPEPMAIEDINSEEPQTFSQPAIAEENSPEPGEGTIPVVSPEVADPAEKGVAVALLVPVPRVRPSPPTAADKHSVPPPKAVARPQIIVSGIAYQENRVVRFAIINDRALGEGEEVEGAVVEEILEDRVRFKIADTAFEVPLLEKVHSRR